MMQHDIVVKAQMTEADLNIGSPVQVTIQAVDQNSTTLTADTDQTGLIGLFRYLNGRGIIVQAITERKHHMKTDIDLRYKDLYTIGGITVWTIAVMTILFIVAFAIWPYIPGRMPTIETYAIIEQGPLAALAALDTGLLIGILMQVPFILALHVSLKRINESLTLIALALAFISVVGVLVSRPVLEVMHFSDLYASAATEAERIQYLAAGDALLSVYHGTTWSITIGFMAIANLIYFILMLRSPHYRRVSAILGIITNGSTALFWVPFMGTPLLLIATVTGIIQAVPIGQDMVRLGRETAMMNATNFAVET